MTEAINPAVGCHYFPPGPRLPPPAAVHHRPLAGTKLYCLVTEAHAHVNNLPRVALGSAAAGIRTRDWSQVRLPNHSATEPLVISTSQSWIVIAHDQTRTADWQLRGCTIIADLCRLIYRSDFTVRGITSFIAVMRCSANLSDLGIKSDLFCGSHQYWNIKSVKPACIHGVETVQVLEWTSTSQMHIHVLM